MTENKIDTNSDQNADFDYRYKSSMFKMKMIFLIFILIPIFGNLNNYYGNFTRNFLWVDLGLNIILTRTIFMFLFSMFMLKKKFDKTTTANKIIRIVYFTSLYLYSFYFFMLIFEYVKRLMFLHGSFSESIIFNGSIYLSIVLPFFIIKKLSPLNNNVLKFTALAPIYSYGLTAFYLFRISETIPGIIMLAITLLLPIFIVAKYLNKYDKVIKVFMILSMMLITYLLIKFVSMILIFSVIVVMLFPNKYMPHLLTLITLYLVIKSGLSLHEFIQYYKLKNITLW